MSVLTNNLLKSILTVLDVLVQLIFFYAIKHTPSDYINNINCTTQEERIRRKNDHIRLSG